MTDEEQAFAHLVSETRAGNRAATDALLHAIVIWLPSGAPLPAPAATYLAQALLAMLDRESPAAAFGPLQNIAQAERDDGVFWDYRLLMGSDSDRMTSAEIKEALARHYAMSPGGVSKAIQRAEKQEPIRASFDLLMRSLLANPNASDVVKREIRAVEDAVSPPGSRLMT